MPDWLSVSVNFLLVQLPKVLKQNLLRTIFAAVILTILVQVAFLNPIFGSTKLKYQLLETMISDSAEVEQIIEYIDSEENTTKDFVFRKGAAQAGYFKTNDQTLIEEWEREVRHFTWDYNDKQKNTTALQAARIKAETFSPPFQIIGRPATVSSPDCLVDRPITNEVFVDSRRDLGKIIRVGKKIKLMNKEGGGTPVIATVAYMRNDSPGVSDFYLNKVQMESMLGQKDQYANLLITLTNEEPNQIIQDDKPESIKCQ